MKKLIALLISLMLLGTLSASADTFAIDSSIKIDTDQLLSIIDQEYSSMYSEPDPEEVDQVKALTTAICEVINRLSSHTLVWENGLQATDSIGNTAIATLYVSLDDGLRIATDMLPHLQLAASQEELSQAAAYLPDLNAIDPNAMLQSYMTILQNFVDSSERSTESGSYTIDDVTYTSKTTTVFSAEAITEARDLVAAQLKQDLTSLMGILAEQYLPDMTIAPVQSGFKLLLYAVQDSTMTLVQAYNEEAEEIPENAAFTLQQIAGESGQQILFFTADKLNISMTAVNGVVSGNAEIILYESEYFSAAEELSFVLDGNERNWTCSDSTVYSGSELSLKTYALRIPEQDHLVFEYGLVSYGTPMIDLTADLHNSTENDTSAVELQLSLCMLGNEQPMMTALVSVAPSQEAIADFPKADDSMRVLSMTELTTLFSDEAAVQALSEDVYSDVFFYFLPHVLSVLQNEMPAQYSVLSNSLIKLITSGLLDF